MAINFNTDPYYDDYDRTKGFYRILFRPGYAVQARELTQLQTMLQAQIARFGDHIFRDGSIVLGGNTFTTPIYYLIVESNDVSNFEDKYIYGLTSGATARVVSIVNGGAETTSTLYFTYTNGLTFTAGEQVFTSDNNFNVYADSTDQYYGTGTAFSIDESVFYVNGFFVYCEPQTIVIGTDDEPPSCRVGLLATESIVEPEDDTSLLDPARGSYNFSAPGATRYAISLDLTSFDYTPSDDPEDNSSEGFVELARYVDGTQVSVTKFSTYAEIENTFARRTYDESGDYTVRAFNIKVQDHIYGNNANLTLTVEPGKAYVKGYEFETIAPTNINLPKSRSTTFNNEFPINANYGQFVYIKNPEGRISYVSGQSVGLYDANVPSDGTITTSNLIGNANVRFIAFDSTDSGNEIYKLYLDNVVLTDSNVASVRGIASNTGNIGNIDFVANIDIDSYTGDVVINTSDNPTYIVKIPKDYVANVVSAETSYRSLFEISGVTFSTLEGDSLTGNAQTSTVTISSPHTFISSLNPEEYVIVVTAQNYGTIPVGLRLDPQYYVVNYLTSTTVNIDYWGPYAGNSDFTATMYVPSFISSPAFKVKTLTSGTVVETVAGDISNVSLGKADIYELSTVSVYTDNATGPYDFTNFYELNNGQTDIAYNIGSARLRDEYDSPTVSIGNVAGAGNVTNVHFQFNYFTHSGQGAFVPDSYLSAIEYSDIPTFTSSSGEVYDLRSCFDFRPRVNDGTSGFTNGSFAAPNELITTDFYNYIGRKDRLVLTKERKFVLLEGIPSETPAVPQELSDAMTLYYLTIPPYTAESSDVSFEYVDNRRYTMRDIGRIERRVEKLEYYTALSLLEKQAADESIPSEVPTIDRFKNGILVDSFAGHSVGDVSKSDYQCSIDKTRRVLRPRFASQSFNYKPVDSGTNQYVYINSAREIATLSYNVETFLNQPLASTFVNLNPYNVFSWNGTLKLNPPSDTWIDTQVRPAVTVNINGENDVFTRLVSDVSNPASVGVVWNDWQTVVSGTTVQDNFSTSSATSTETVNDRILETTTSTTINNQTSTTTETLARVGIEISTGATRTITRDLGTRVVDTSIVPFIRSRLVDYVGRAMKPQTELIALFDDIEVTPYCTPAVELLIPSGVPARAETVRISQGATTVMGNVLHKAASNVQTTNFDRVYVKFNNGIPFAGNVISFYANTTLLESRVIGDVIYSTDTGDINGNVVIKTNDSGDVVGTFFIPSTEDLRFRTGERMFKLTDYNGPGATTAAATKYVAQGLSQSVERTLVATRVAHVSVNPLMDVSTTSCTTTSSIVVNTTTTTVDVTPPPPPPPPPPPIVRCGINQSGSGRTGRFIYTIDFGTETGTVGINYDAMSSIPDRFTIIWDGNRYTTGFVGGASYNSELNNLGFPSVSGPRTGALTFNKTKASPSTATLIVDAPIRGTGWAFGIRCPVVNPPPRPYNSSNLVMVLNAVSNVGWPAQTTGTQTIPVRVNVYRTDGVKGSDCQASLTASTVTGNPAGTQTLNPNSFTIKTGQQRVINFTLSRPLSPFRYITKVSGTALELSTGKTAFANINITARGVQPTVNIDPVAQTFFVNAQEFPNGVFLSSIDLYFRSKSTTGVPVQVHLRPTVNGYPSSRDIIPFSVVTKTPAEVNISANGSAATNFEFEAPVYLAPGEYSFVALSNTDEYVVYTARIGDNLLTNPTVRITEQPAIGSMFKSQNSSTWSPIQEEDVKFKINRCVFTTAGQGELLMYPDIEPEYGTVPFDVYHATGEVLNFGATNIQHYYKTTNASDNVISSAYARYQDGSNAVMNTRKHVRSTSPQDLQSLLVFGTVDPSVSPVIDLTRFRTTLVSNVVNNDSTGETNPRGGNALARYITRKVTLAPNFESLDLKVFLLANLPTGTSIKVYYKVAPVTDPLFEDNNWVQMVVESSGVPSEVGFVEYKYKTSTENAIESGDRFKIFAIKIVMLSSDTTRVPQIRDLRVIALDD